MSIFEKVENKCAEGLYNIAMSKYAKASATDCLFLTFYEPEFIKELINDEE